MEVSQMRWISRLLIVLVVCLVAMALPAAPVQAAGPVITLSLSPGVPGDEVTVHGSNFTLSKNYYVDIYYDVNGNGNWTDEEWVTDVRTEDDGSFEVTFNIPESYKGVHAVRAREATSGYVAEADFTVRPGLTVSPAEGPVGTNVTVQGHGFAKNETRIELSYYLNSTNSKPIPGNITANATGNWQKSFQIPASAKGSHKIDAQGASSSLAQVRDVFFEVTPGISLDKSSGTVGENITMTGSGFYANDRYIKILFAGKEVNAETRVDADDQGNWVKDFEVPDMPKGTYNVTAYGESTPREDITAVSFEIKPGIALSPAEGHVGTDLSVTGGGFAANKDVVIKYDGSQKATAPTDDKGSFEASFVVPESQHDNHTVTADDAAGNNATAIFTMESVPPPVPELKSPADGSRVGFIGKVRPTFNWSAVSDESGVYYNLQIATSKNVTASGEFVHPLVSVSSIVGTNYTLNATDAMPYGTYYWIVRAVDRAENAGNWTATRSFGAGVLPLWAFIVIIVATVAVIGTLVYFLVIRRRTQYY
jgi:hypothetical protein